MTDDTEQPDLQVEVAAPPGVNVTVTETPDEPPDDGQDQPETRADEVIDTP